MQINGYSKISMSAYRSSDMQSKNGLPQTNTFIQMLQNANTSATKNTKTSADDEMEAFKKEIYAELAQINGMNSSSILSNSVHITKDGFQRMKDDPAYRKKIMDWLRADAAASHGLPYGVHVTTTITGSGATSYGENVYPDDSDATKSIKKSRADKKAEEAFYYAKRKKRQEATEAFLLKQQQNRDISQKIVLANAQNQKARIEAAEQIYIQNYKLNIQQSKSWNV